MGKVYKKFINERKKRLRKKSLCYILNPLLCAVEQLRLSA